MTDMEKNQAITEIQQMIRSKIIYPAQAKNITVYDTDGNIFYDLGYDGFYPEDVDMILTRLKNEDTAYAKVGEARNLASVIGEDELSPIDKKYLEFGKAFEERYIGQGPNENRTIEETLDLGWELLRILPKEELDRVDTKILDVYYKG